MAFFGGLSTDDYNFTPDVAIAWRETGSLWEVLRSAARVTRVYFNGWQGTFAGVFLMTLHPAAFNENLYFLAPLMLLSGFIAALFYFLKVGLMDVLNAERHDYIVAAVVVTALHIHFLPSPVEAFYWWNGGMFYTGFYALALTLCACLLRGKINAAGGLGLGALAFAVGGGSYPVALLTVLAVAGIGAYHYMRHKKIQWEAVLCFVAVGVALGISALSPGSAVRQTAFAGMGFFETIFQSVVHALRFAGANALTHVPVLAAFACITPTLYRVAADSRFTFKWPALAVGMAFGAYAATFAPSLYTMGHVVHGRILNISFYALLLFILFAWLYLCGWVARRFNLGKQAVTPVAVAALAVLFCLSTAAMGLDNHRKVTGVSALRSLQNREAIYYRREMRERRALYNDPNITDAIVSPYTVRPWLLYTGELGADEAQTGIASFYGKQSIRLRP
jgi:hypothetical protein